MRFAHSLTPLFSGEMEGWRISSWSLAMCCGRFLSMWAKTFPRSSGMISPDISHSISVDRRLLWIRLDCGGGKASLEETSGNPVVYGSYDAGADKTIVVYMMYDTMPVDEPGWRVDPLAGTLTDVPPFGRCLVARGSFNKKGELRRYLKA